MTVLLAVCIQPLALGLTSGSLLSRRILSKCGIRRKALQSKIAGQSFLKLAVFTL